MPRVNLRVAGGEEIDRAMGEQKSQQGKQNAAGMEAPGQQQSCGKLRDIIKESDDATCANNGLLTSASMTASTAPPGTNHVFQAFPFTEPRAKSRA